MAVQTLVLLLALELEDENLIGTILTGNRGEHFGIVEIAAGEHAPVGIACGDETRKLQLCTDFGGDGLDPNFIAWSNTVLFAAR